MQAFSIAAKGMMTQVQRVNTAAQNIANAHTPGYKAQSPDSPSVPAQGAAAPLGAAGTGALMQAPAEPSDVDLASEITTMIMAQRTYEANAKVLKTADDMTKSLLQWK